ncbi:hypothetical protein, partial [Rhizobium leguminosarum]|uniref:hypothetical protein n=1 Tax=Rhizobium leguminosarum TaxID=384 RepID=UPI001953BA6D
PQYVEGRNFEWHGSDKPMKRKNTLAKLEVSLTEDECCKWLHTLHEIAVAGSCIRLHPCHD